MSLFDSALSSCYMRLLLAGIRCRELLCVFDKAIAFEILDDEIYFA